MKESRKIYKLVGLITFFLIYIITLICENNFWRNIIFPMISFFISYFLIVIAKKVDRYKISWVLLSLSCFSLGICDLLWEIYDFILKINPQNVDLFMYIYIIPNFFFWRTI